MVDIVWLRGVWLSTVLSLSLSPVHTRPCCTILSIPTRTHPDTHEVRRHHAAEAKGGTSRSAPPAGGRLTQRVATACPMMRQTPTLFKPLGGPSTSCRLRQSVNRRGDTERPKMPLLCCHC